MTEQGRNLEKQIEKAALQLINICINEVDSTMENTIDVSYLVYQDLQEKLAEQLHRQEELMINIETSKIELNTCNNRIQALKEWLEQNPIDEATLQKYQHTFTPYF